MNEFIITIQDTEVKAAMQALVDRVQNIDTELATIGEKLVERAKHRFDTSSGPDGAPWRKNSNVTLQIFQDRFGKSYRKKSGDLNAKGNAKLANKKPLIDIGTLRQQLVYEVSDNSLTVGNTQLYAAIQQFGGQAGRNHKVTIPARPFLPFHQDGSLYPDDRAMILDDLNNYIASLKF